MKIVEGLKELRIIEKRMNKNIEQISEYSSILNVERPVFGDEETQRKKVSQLIQSNNDLLKEYLELKRRIDRTNLEVTVEIRGEQYTLADALAIKRKLSPIMLDTYNALTTHAADKKLMVRKMASESGQVVSVVRLYREEDKLEGLSKWQDLYDNIESRLEVINATRDLLE